MNGSLQKRKNEARYVGTRPIIETGISELVPNIIDKPGPTRKNNSTIPTVTTDKDVAQGDKERPPPQGECCPRLEFGTVNGVIVTGQLPPGVEGQPHPSDGR